MTALDVLLSLSVITLVGVTIALLYLREKDHIRHSNERWELLNRIMARDWSSYIALAHEKAPGENQAPAQEQPVELTKDYDGAWTK